MKRRTILDIEYALSSNNIVPASVGCPNEAWLFIFAGSTFTVFHRGWTKKQCQNIHIHAFFLLRAETPYREFRSRNGRQSLSIIPRA